MEVLDHLNAKAEGTLYFAGQGIHTARQMKRNAFTKIYDEAK